ncbi:hypothetical protein [Azovibrio restrictus]|uniref:hypothetical protein n=1 Tax=Azovibrio restrictus TaxID=146938 RepID=UPI0026F303FA|nr:hypothetical protein [Azovibrio restrictus]
MHLTLLIPDLLWPEPGDAETLASLACPSLEKWLGRSRLARQERHPMETVLAWQLGLGDQGLAACRLLGEPNAPAPGDTTWYSADPIHLQFHHERIILGDASLLELEAGEVEALVESLNRSFPDLGRFHAPHPRRWYLEAAAGLEIPPLPPLSAAAGRQLGALMPESPPLSRLMNELQMLLHTHPVNQAREGRRQPLINGLWLWGGGVLPTARECRHDAVLGSHPLALGMARHLRLPARPAPASLTELLQNPTCQHPLVLLENLVAPTLIEDGDAWKTSLEQMERDWFAPLSSALGHGIDSLELVCPTAFGVLRWQGRSQDRWKFWKSPQPLASLIRKLAAQAQETQS